MPVDKACLTAETKDKGLERAVQVQLRVSPAPTLIAAEFLLRVEVATRR